LFLVTVGGSRYLLVFFSIFSVLIGIILYQSFLKSQHKLEQIRMRFMIMMMVWLGNFQHLIKPPLSIILYSEDFEVVLH